MTSFLYVEVDEYRRKHKRCKYCIYLKHVYHEIGFQAIDSYKCRAKDKSIYFPNRFPRNYCSCFHLKDYNHSE